jgi:hypothetical protein
MKFGHGSPCLFVNNVVQLNSHRAAGLNTVFKAVIAAALRSCIAVLVLGGISCSAACAALPPTTSEITVTPSTVSFGSVPLGTTNSQTIQVRNNTTASITNAFLSLSAAGFQLADAPSSTTIAPGASMSFNVVFTPSAATKYAGQVYVISGKSILDTIAISGAGIASTVALAASATAINFGSETVGGKYSEYVTLTSNGNSSVTISTITASGAGFGASGVAKGTVLKPEQSVKLEVTFNPVSTGTASGKIVIGSNAAAATTIALSGTAAAATEVGQTTHSVSLKWDTAPSAVGYYVYRGSNSGGPYTLLNSTAVTAADYVDSTVVEGQTYYYVVTSINEEKAQSSYSNQAEVTVPNP